MKRVLLPFVVIAILITIGFFVYPVRTLFLSNGVYQNLTPKEGEVLKGEETSPKKDYNPPAASSPSSEDERAPISMAEKLLEGKSIAMVIAFRDFRDIEYFIPRDILQGAGAKIMTVSSQKGQAVGADGGEVNVNQDFSEFQAENFDAVIFIGGPGMAKKLDDESFQKIARDAVESGKVLGAICVAPALLANAGALDGKKATVWSAPLDKGAIRILEENGAVYEDKTVVVDGKIVTGNGPGAAKEFAQAIIGVLTKE